MHARADVTPEGIKRLIETFAELGITQPQIEARIQRRLDAIRPAQVVMLRKIFTSLKDGMSEPADWFEAVPLAQPAEGRGQAAGAAAATAPPAPHPRARADADAVTAATPAHMDAMTEDNPAPPQTEQPEVSANSDMMSKPAATGRRQVQFEV